MTLEYVGKQPHFKNKTKQEGAELCQAQRNFIKFDLVQGILIINQLKQTFLFQMNKILAEV